MKVDIHFLPNQLLPDKLPAVESPHLISHWTSHHGQLDFHLFPSFFCHFENVPIKHIADLAHKIIFGIDEGKDLAVSAKNAFVSLFRLAFSPEILGVGRAIRGCQGSRVDNAPPFIDNLKLNFLVKGTDKLEPLFHQIVDRSFKFNR